MPSNFHVSASAAVPAARPDDRAIRRTVLDIFQRHIKTLSHIPGEVSQFAETGVGYEWRCQLSLGQFASGQSLKGVPCSLQLHFSLIDLHGRGQPVAVLYLVEQARDSDWQERQLLSLLDAGGLQEQLNLILMPLAPTLGALEKASLFIDALIQVRDEIDSEVNWI